MNLFDEFFAEVFTTTDPLVVVVGDEKWKPEEDPKTPRSIWIHYLLIVAGGISEDVSPGIYHVNLAPKWFKTQLTLEPVVKL